MRGRATGGHPVAGTTASLAGAERQRGRVHRRRRRAPRHRRWRRGTSARSDRSARSAPHAGVGVGRSRWCVHVQPGALGQTSAQPPHGPAVGGCGSMPPTIASGLQRLTAAPMPSLRATRIGSRSSAIGAWPASSRASGSTGSQQDARLPCRHHPGGRHARSAPVRRAPSGASQAPVAQAEAASGEVVARRRGSEATGAPVSRASASRPPIAAPSTRSSSAPK